MSGPAMVDAVIVPTATTKPRRAALGDYLALTKPRIALMVLFTVTVGYVAGARTAPAVILGGGSPLSRWAHNPPGPLVLTLLGAGLVAAGASVWNQYLERTRDGRMRRTAGRPLPDGRLSPGEAAVFGTALAGLGIALLALGTNAVAVAVAAATFHLYAFVYTPLKPLTTLNTAVGAIPGALPPVIGWAAATGGLEVGAWALFLIVFLWQFPHFLAIAWIYRDDYARGGHRMLPIVDPAGTLTGRQATGYALALVPAGLLPTVVGMAGPWYFGVATVLGVYYLVRSLRFWAERTDANARRLMMASFLYLPLILAMLLANPATP